MVLVIFSMFLMDFRRPSISRRVAKFAALMVAGLVVQQLAHGSIQLR